MAAALFINSPDFALYSVKPLPAHQGSFDAVWYLAQDSLLWPNRGGVLLYLPPVLSHVPCDGLTGPLTEEISLAACVVG